MCVVWGLRAVGNVGSGIPRITEKGGSLTRSGALAYGEEMLKEVALPIALILIMLGMGMTLVPADFKRVFVKPLASVLGLCLQLLLLPVVAFLLCKGFGLPAELAVGLMLIAACPGGATSNLISHLSNGDTALSVSLTAVSSLVTTLTIPLVMGFAMSTFMDSAQAVSVPFVKTVIQLMVVSVIPIVVGMGLRSKCPGFCAKCANDGVPFWMPDSIANVTRCRCPSRNNAAKPKPNAIVSTLRLNAAGPAVLNWAPRFSSCITAATTISSKNTIEKIFTGLAHFAQNPGHFDRKPIPTTIGMTDTTIN